MKPENKEEEKAIYNPDNNYAPVTSFGELDTYLKARKMRDELFTLNSAFMEIIDGILYNSDVTDKAAALRVLVGEYIDRMGLITSNAQKETGEWENVAQVGDSEYENGEKVTNNFNVVLDKIVEDDTSRKVQHKRENGMDFPAKDYAYVPDPQRPSTWKLRLTESPGKFTVAQLGRAAAALSAAGFRGNRVKMPSSVVTAVKRRLRAEYKKLGIDTAAMPSTVRQDSSAGKDSQFHVWKDKDGTYRWFAVYSKNFRDDDYPQPEILSEQAHKAFHALVKAGDVDYPELWHWHEEKTAWGKADFLDFHDGFAVAAGYVYEGHEKEAEAVSRMPYPVGVSHGMPVEYIIRDAEDDTILNFYISKEISDLALDAAANKHTGFVILNKENDMSLSARAKQYLTDANVDPDLIGQIDGSVDFAKEAATDEGRDTKDIDPEETTEDADPTIANATVNVDIDAEAVGNIIDPIVETMKQLNDNFMKTTSVLLERVADLEAKVKELQVDDEQKIAKQSELTPTASFEDLIKQRVFGQDDSYVHGNDTLSRSKPEEKKAPPKVMTGLSFLDGKIAAGTTQ
jgi:hypothetical protein